MLVAAAAAALVRETRVDRAGTLNREQNRLEVEHDEATNLILDAVGSTRGLPAAPVSPRTGAQAGWSGTEVIIWSGALETRGGAAFDGPGDRRFQVADGGAAYDPRTRQWRQLPHAPIAARTGAAAVWAGDRLVVWGGFAAVDEPLDDGAVYLAAEDAWRVLSRAPLSPRGDVIAAWTGQEVLLIGGSDRSAREWGHTRRVHRDGAAYDPATGQWRPLPSLPGSVWPVAGRFVGGGRVTRCWCGDRTWCGMSRAVTPGSR